MTGCQDVQVTVTFCRTWLQKGPEFPSCLDDAVHFLCAVMQKAPCMLLKCNDGIFVLSCAACVTWLSVADCNTGWGVFAVGCCTCRQATHAPPLQQQQSYR